MTLTCEEMKTRAIVAGSLAYSRQLRGGRGAAAAERAYRRAYAKTIPPCWRALMPEAEPHGEDRSEGNRPFITV